MFLFGVSGSILPYVISIIAIWSGIILGYGHYFRVDKEETPKKIKVENSRNYFSEKTNICYDVDRSLSDQKIKHYYAGCKAFIFPQEEDFGITAVEAQAAGKPIIAFEKGGSVETITKGISGVFFNKSTIEDLKNAVYRFENTEFDPQKIKDSVKNFSLNRFRKEVEEFITNSKFL